MADERRPWISAELSRTTGEKAVLVGIEPSSDAQSAVAHDAITLDVAAHTRIEVSFGLERGGARLARRVAPDGLGRVKAPDIAAGRRARLRDADPHVALEAKALLAVAARA